MGTYDYKIDDYIRIIRRRWMLVVAIALLVTASAVIFTTLSRTGGQDPASSGRDDAQGTAVVAVLYEPSPLRDSDPPSGARERLIALSREVIEAAVEDIPGSPDADDVVDALEVVPVTDEGVLLFEASDLPEAEGQLIAQSVATSYLDLRQARFDAAFAAAEESLRAQIRAARSVRGSQLLVSLRLSGLHTELARLQTLRATTSAGEILDPPLDSAELLGEESPEPAEPATTSPGNASIERNGVAGLVLGSILGFLVALVLDLMDPRFRSTREIRERLPVALLEEVPRDPAGAREERIKELAAQIGNLIRAETRRTLAAVSVGAEKAWPADELRTHLNAVGVELDMARSSSLTSAASADAALLILDIRESTREDAQRNLEVLERSGVDVVGAAILV